MCTHLKPIHALKLVLPLGCTRKQNGLATKRDCIAVTRCDLIVHNVTQTSSEAMSTGDAEVTIKLLLRPRQLIHISPWLSFLLKTSIISSPGILGPQQYLNTVIACEHVTKKAAETFSTIIICLLKAKKT